MNLDSSAELGELRAQVARLRAENAALRAQGEELVPMNSRIARLLESQAMGVLIANLDGEIVAINPAFERIIGRTNLHAKYFDWRECVPPEELKRHEEHARILGETGWCAPWETALLRPDGTRVPIMTGASLIGSDDENATSAEKSTMLVWALDISQRLVAENQLRASESQMRAIVENLHDGLIITDLNDTILYANGRMSEMTGYSNAELKGQTAYRLLGDPQIWPECERHNAQRANGQSGTYEVPLRHRDGSTRWMLINGSPLRDDHGEIVGTIGAHFDYTQRKSAEAQRAHFAAQLEQSNRELETFAFAVSHDLKQPLRKIEVFSSRLQSEEAANLSEDGQLYLDRIRGCARRMTDLINGLLSYSRVATGHAPPSEIDLNEIAREVMLDLELAVERAGARVIIGDLPRVSASATQMHQLLQNLVGNALEYRRPDVASVVRVSARVHDGICQLEVADNGRGFEPEQATQIFEIFSHLGDKTTEAATSTGAHGTGVGLTICRAILQRHGGTLTAQGAPGRGATFCARFPVAPPAAQDEIIGGNAIDR